MKGGCLGLLRWLCLQRDAITPPTWGLDESTQRAAAMAPMGAGLRGVLGPSEADGPVYVAIAGKMRGYVVYTLSPAGGAANARDGGTHRTRPQELKLRELVWLDVDAYRSLCVRCLVYSILVASSA